MANTNEIRGLNDGELDARIMETKEELLRLRVQHATLQHAALQHATLQH